MYVQSTIGWHYISSAPNCNVTLSCERLFELNDIDTFGVICNTKDVGSLSECNCTERYKKNSRSCEIMQIKTLSMLERWKLFPQIILSKFTQFKQGNNTFDWMLETRNKDFFAERSRIVFEAVVLTLRFILADMEWRLNQVTMEFFLNVFTELAEFSDKNICH